MTADAIDHVRRLREALDSLADEAVPGDICPDAGQLWDAARGELPHHEAQEVVDHLSACRACSRVWQLAVDLTKDLPPAVAPVPVGVTVMSSWTLARLAPVFVGSLAVMIAGTLVFQIFRVAQPPPTTDSATRQFIEPGELVEIVGPNGAVTSTPTQFEWQAVSGAKIYQVRVYAEDGTLVWTSDDLTATSTAWPASVTLGAAPYYWGVTALSDGEIVAESGLTIVELTPSE